MGSEISIFDSGMLAMNAGPNDEYAMVQFTAPANGLYTIQGTFEGIDTVGTVSSVYLLVNNACRRLWQCTGFWARKRSQLSFGPFPLTLGQTLAYAVGGTPLNSMTALIDAQVSRRRRSGAITLCVGQSRHSRTRRARRVCSQTQGRDRLNTTR